MCYQRNNTVLDCDGVPATRNEVMKRNIRVSYYDQATRSTLHVLASTENNNSVIVCTAVVGGATLNQFSTTPVVLKVQGWCLYCLSTSCTLITNELLFFRRSIRSSN